MNVLKSSLGVYLRRIVPALLVAVAPLSHASTIWNGPDISFTHAPPDNLADQLTPGVAITRGSSGGLYNSVTESGATAGVSPADTEWAVGLLADFNTLTYAQCPLEAGNRPPNFVGTNYVVHLISEDIYLSLTLTAWGGAGGGGIDSFSYTRSTPGQTTTPTVTITNPTNGAVFAAPATVTVGATAAVSGGTVTNVQFFTNGVSLGSVLTAPFSLTAGNLAAGTYALTAVATAGGNSATSSVVTVMVVIPPAVNLSGAGLINGQFSFNFAANAGVPYVIQSSSNLLDWVSLATNVATAGSVPFSGPFNPVGTKFYRVGRLPNP